MTMWEAGIHQFPAVIWVDAMSYEDATVILTFGTRIEGQPASLRIKLTQPQWENLKFLVDGPKPSRQ
jgi:hypothetical protein